MKKTEDWLYELGYDAREELVEEGEAMSKFMRDVKEEHLLEVNRYSSFILDTSDDYYMKMKNNGVKRK